ncbi:NAD dependent epimerase/dehydratase [Drechmeria coniospora]|uniref:NAD dependent epimerase/dehydratase n=1 Tax=Drechmeria coniospora TaxID=98403 RepID=A0A151GQ13_DRECN|nr:NAD dependent epimerase/dehydratase [Drechmeria coniospora]KYK59151.1 NAD dependent epimerase/dehydratase [Drechmeria coniospora]
MGGVPSMPSDRTRTLQVIGAGYSRTGTVSMALALEKLLDGPVMHGGTHLFGREDAYPKLWCEIFRQRNNKPVLMKLLREATAGFVGLTDAPGTMFLPELLELYPEAKVVLVTRDPHRWLRSMELIMRNIGMKPWVLEALLFPCPTWRWTPTVLGQMGEKESERLGIKLGPEYLPKYNEYVRAHVQPEKLLTMELKEGWDPLAKFLDAPVPKEPFPRANDAQAFEAYARRIVVTAGLVWTGILLAIGLAVWGTWQLSR